ncbi:alpha/beta hydrolase [Leisingera aquaemixtae]|uniref:Exosortase A system-associated hydrolase 1 n=1 Tax=Leisingera aquaemixtae TaxID=1396826 RepID=A0A0P1H6J0_9RHOB|nr:alpha/beta hydrolase [Leisingera aquaemixtae]CUH98521.1 exosortase A system-associated hydrolase 1 [Leisingera aquaemixtae]
MDVTRRMFAGLITGSAVAASLPAAAQTTASPMYEVRDVTFPSGAETLAGKFFMPPGEGPFPAVAVVGPVAFVKEQSPVQYATRLARQGLAVLIFDPRYHGASSGEPRRFESGEAKTEDIGAALTFLAAQEGVAQNKLGVLGICQGVNWAIEAAVRDRRVSALGIVAGHYLTPATATLYLGDDQAIAARMERAAEARAVYENSGEVRYIPIIGSDEALLTAELIAQWYAPWDNRAPWFAYRGGWENRITAMSEEVIWGWKINETITRLQTPVLMVHGDKAASGPMIPRELFDTIPAADKALHWIKGANQLQFYEDPLVIDAALAPLAAHFKKGQ